MYVHLYTHINMQIYTCMYICVCIPHSLSVSLSHTHTHTHACQSKLDAGRVHKLRQPVVPCRICAFVCVCVCVCVYRQSLCHREPAECPTNCRASARQRTWAHCDARAHNAPVCTRNNGCVTPPASCAVCNISHARSRAMPVSVRALGRASLQGSAEWAGSWLRGRAPRAPPPPPTPRCSPQPRQR